MFSLEKTNKLHEEALELMPGGHSNLRMPFGAYPNFFVRGKGARLWDVDGNEYIDFICTAGAASLGNCHPELVAAMTEQLNTLHTFFSGAAQAPHEIELAKKIIQHVPAAEKVRFCLSGTEAVQLAIRLARAFTGRRYFIRFEGSYHGWLDNVLGGKVQEDPVNNPFPTETAEDPHGTDGRDPAAFEQCFRLPFNDIEIFERVVEKWGEQIGLVHLEAIVVNSGPFMPRPGYLERIRELCDKHGILLSFDEVITGFRVALGGAQEVTGVTPDLATFGKALAAGIPISAIVGRAEVMDQLYTRKVLGAGTFNGYPLGTAAALATIKILERDDGAIYKWVDEVEGRLIAGLKEIAGRYDLPLLLLPVRGCFGAHFIDREEASCLADLVGEDYELLGGLRTVLAEEGVLMMWGGRWYITGVLTDQDVDDALERADAALKRLKG